ncbi:MAG: DNA methyltransferase [Nitrososphaerales archaeon]
MSEKVIKKTLRSMEVLKGFIQIPTNSRSELIGDMLMPSNVLVNGMPGRLDKYARIWSPFLKGKFSAGSRVQINRTQDGYQVELVTDEGKSVVKTPAKSENRTNESERVGFNGLTPKEWTQLSKSVWSAREVSSAREWYHLKHGATFSVALAERVIKMYTKEGDLVLDPFVGVGTTLVAARNLERRGIGIELYDKFVDLAKEVLGQQTLIEKPDQKVICGDCRELLKWVEPNSVQLMFTSPPYANFIIRSIEDRKKTHKTSRLVFDNKSVVKQYGEDPRDFGNLPYDAFLKEIKALMRKLILVTKPGGYNVWVVKDCRDPQNGRPFIDFHSDIAHIGKKVGFLYHDLIVWDQNEQRSLVLLGYPTVFYVNINHTFLVVLRKPQEANTKASI